MSARVATRFLIRWSIRRAADVSSDFCALDDNPAPPSRKPAARRTLPPCCNHVPKFSRAAAEASSSLSGMIFCTESTKVWPLECMGTTTSGSNAFNSETT
jgi:hypothetical protein